MPYKDREAKRAYDREWIRKRRANWLAENGPCVDCGTWDNLEVDHVDASLKISSNVWSWTEKRRIAELAKCVVRCHPCHVTKTVARLEMSHGTAHGSNKLTIDQVLAIRASDETYRILAERYEVDYSLVYQIKKRKIWKHI